MRDALGQVERRDAVPDIVGYTPRAGAAGIVVHGSRAGDGQREGGVVAVAERDGAAVVGQCPCEVRTTCTAIHHVAHCGKSRLHSCKGHNEGNQHTGCPPCCAQPQGQGREKVFLFHCVI